MKFGAAGDKPKPKGALAALVVGAPASSSEDAAPADDHGFKALAKAFGIPPERHAQAQAALKHYIQACTASETEPDLESDEEY